MKVRDRLLDKKEYKGMLTEASDKICPCRICWNPHDCGYRGGNGKWITAMRCVTNYKSGCPLDINKKLPRPIHIIRAKAGGKGQTRICLRCGQRVVIGEVDFITFEAYQRKNYKGGKMMFPTIKTYYEKVKKNSERDEFSRKLKNNIEKLVVEDKKYSWEDEADLNFIKAAEKGNEK